MSAVCVCKRPAPAGEGESEHCTTCGAWTSAAIAAHYAREDRERSLRAVAELQRTADMGKRSYMTEREAALIKPGRCEFCGSAKHALADCTLNGARSYRAEKACPRCHGTGRLHGKSASLYGGDIVETCPCRADGAA